MSDYKLTQDDLKKQLVHFQKKKSDNDIILLAMENALQQELDRGSSFGEAVIRYRRELEALQAKQAMVDETIACLKKLLNN